MRGGHSLDAGVNQVEHRPEGFNNLPIYLTGTLDETRRKMGKATVDVSMHMEQSDGSFDIQLIWKIEKWISLKSLPEVLPKLTDDVII
jgi:hypothetical protein